MSGHVIDEMNAQGFRVTLRERHLSHWTSRWSAWCCTTNLGDWRLQHMEQV